MSLYEIPQAIQDENDLLMSHIDDVDGERRTILMKMAARSDENSMRRLNTSLSLLLEQIGRASCRERV